MTNEMTFAIHLKRRKHGRVELVEGEAPPEPVWTAQPARIARLVALAHRIESLVRAGQIEDYAEVAEVSGITRARVSQITNLLLLAPDLQEQLLFQLRPARGRELVGESDVRPIALEPDWGEQRRMFAKVLEARDG
jgi:hypothetical protein